MANKIRAKMDISNRAKQFMPFAALKGLPEALAEKELIVVPNPPLFEDKIEEMEEETEESAQNSTTYHSK